MRWLCPDGYWVYGEVTIPREDDSKVIFNGNEDWNYDYYPNKDLQRMTPEDTSEPDENRNKEG